MGVAVTHKDMSYIGLVSNDVDIIVGGFLPLNRLIYYYNACIVGLGLVGTSIAITHDGAII